MRKESIVRLDDDGEQKEFKIRQMSASRGERFFYQLLLLLGADAKMEMFEDPGAIFAALASQPYDKVQALLDEMLSCVSRVTDGIETQLTPDNVDGFIESPITLFKLRAEVFKANNFFQKLGQTRFDGFNAGSPLTIKRQG
jgi:hypothetical protein